MDKTTGFRKSDKNSKTWQANILKKYTHTPLSQQKVGQKPNKQYNPKQNNTIQKQPTEEEKWGYLIVRFFVTHKIYLYPKNNFQRF